MSKALLWQFWGNAALSGGLYGKLYLLVRFLYNNMSMRTYASTVETTFSNLSRYVKPKARLLTTTSIS